MLWSSYYSFGGKKYISLVVALRIYFYILSERYLKTEVNIPMKLHKCDLS